MRALSRVLGTLALVVALVSALPLLLVVWSAYRGAGSPEPGVAAWAGVAIAAIGTAVGLIGLVIARRPFAAMAVIGTLVAGTTLVGLAVGALMLPAVS